VQAIDPREEPVRAQFSAAHVVYAGAHTSCACGFRPESPEESAESRRSRTGLAEYVAEAARQGSVHVFVCWEGDWAQAPERSFRLSPADLIESADWLTELTFVHVAA
jgi:hypothetical protein